MSGDKIGGDKAAAVRRHSKDLNGASRLGEVHPGATFDGAGDGDEGAQCRDAIVDIRSVLCGSFEDAVGESFELRLVGIGILADDPAVLAVFGAEAFDYGGFMKPGKVDLALNAAELAMDLESLFEVAPDGNGEVEMTEAAVFEFDIDPPAIGSKSFEQSSTYGGDRAAQQSRRID